MIDFTTVQPLSIPPDVTKLISENKYLKADKRHLTFSSWILGATIVIGIFYYNSKRFRDNNNSQHNDQF
jgi:hypothetical protein